MMEWENKYNLTTLADECYPVVTVFEYGEQPTHEQMTALFRKWKQDGQGKTWREFACSAQPGHDCIMVKWCGMWLGIERDGYTHS